MTNIPVMRRDHYDSDDDGKVDAADEADALADGAIVDGGLVEE